MYRKSVSNTGLYLGLMYLMGFISSICGIWVIVEFIIYLVKDNPFNFMSLWLTIITFILQIIFLLKAFLSFK